MEWSSMSREPVESPSCCYRRCCMQSSRGRLSSTAQPKESYSSSLSSFCFSGFILQVCIILHRVDACSSCSSGLISARCHDVALVLQLEDFHRRFLINFSFHLFFEIRLLITLFIKKNFCSSVLAVCPSAAWGQKTSWPPLHFCKESRILTRGCPRFLIDVLLASA